MHILVTNDDGPPSSQSSPYVHCLVKHLQAAGHTVSVCLPHTQRSWIGKAHMIGQTLKPLYYRPSTGGVHEASGTTHSRPSADTSVEEWVLIDGTPASCVQIGLHHFFKDRGPVDLVVSGPNYGRNTTAVFALSSGTLGAALEAAVCKQKSIALSFAFFTRNHDPEIIEAACRHSVRVIDALWKQWPSSDSLDLYSVNVPLVEGVEGHKTVFTEMLQNYWRDGSCFEEIEGDVGDEHEEEEKIREGKGGEIDGGKKGEEREAKTQKHKHFKWAPRFADVYKSVEESQPGNDGWAVKEGQTSVTPLKANFASGLGASGPRELELPAPEATPLVRSLPIRTKQSEVNLQAVVAYDDTYVQPLILSALNNVFPSGNISIADSLPSDFSLSNFSSSSKILNITSYETIDFEYASDNPSKCLINSYMIRKALIRKHYLSTTVDHWTAKNPDSILKTHVKRSEAFEVDYAEFLDDALVEAFDLRESMDRNEERTEEEKEWWILKPGMSDRGQGIRLFSSMEELQAIFDGWDEGQPDTDDEDDDENAAAAGGDYMNTSHLRHFVAQPYIDPPLLLSDRRKFHIRTYVLCVGSLRVHVYKDMLALFAAKPYVAPSSSTSNDIESFLTNTCLQDSPNSTSVQRFWSLSLPQTQLDSIFSQICEMTGELFEGAARAMPIHFQTLPNAFEVFGLDFMVDQEGQTWLLEVNAFPDFKQTGGDLKEIVRGFWEGVAKEAIGPFFGIEGQEGKGDGMVLARDVDLGRR